MTGTRLVVDRPPKLTATILCSNNGESTSNAFSVTALSTGNIGNLKNIIKAATTPLYDDIPADQLILWGFIDALPVVNNVVTLSGNQDGRMLNSVMLVSDFLSMYSGTGTGTETGTHLIVDRPPKSMTTATVFCVANGDTSWNAFPVIAQSTDCFGRLKNLIKAAKSPLYDDIPADKLTLWGFSRTFQQSDVINVDSIPEKVQLHPLLAISDFLNQYQNVLNNVSGSNIHVAVVRPPKY
ncbi:hypothetical protein BGX26_004114 [Mortierella sp. AD094]|nr:hypothetical protein BGX26_004114 [Mortierella sp. AD094]